MLENDRLYTGMTAAASGPVSFIFVWMLVGWMMDVSTEYQQRLLIIGC